MPRLNKLTGQVDPVALTPLGNGRARLDVELAAGDSILFKYATGKPFALAP